MNIRYALNVILFTSVLLLSSLKANADDDISIHQTCENSPLACLAKIDVFLSKETSESRVWFQYKLYQLKSLFQLSRYEQLYVEVTPWILRDDIPLKFKISAHIYYAKLLAGQGEKALANDYLERAIAILEDVNEVSPDPLLKVQIANTLNALGRYEQGYALLKPLEAKYSKRDMPVFKQDLFENLGHFAYRLGLLDEQLIYRKQAVKYAKQLDNPVILAISIYNLARAYQMLENYPLAFKYFEQAEQLEAMGETDQNMIWYRRAEMSLAQGNVSEARQYFNHVNRVGAIQVYAETFDKLDKKISIAEQE